MNKYISRLFFEVSWECLIYENQDILLNRKRINEPEKIIVCKNRYWCADPFLVKDDYGILIFAEILDRNKSRGKLGYARLDNTRQIKIAPGIDLKCHTSYPNVFHYNDSWYMIPETFARKTIELYKATDFPSRWEIERVLEDNISAVDTTYFFKDNRCFLFIYEPKGMTNTLSIAELNLVNKTLINRKVVKEYCDRIGRPAGNIIVLNGRMIRPTQYGVNRYGEKIVFKEFTFDTNNYEYTENDISEIKVNEIGEPRALGVHTYNRCGKFEVIDYCVNKFFPLKPFAILFKKMKVLGYSYAKVEIL